MSTGDGIIRNITDELAIRHDAAVAEQKRLERLIERHKRKLKGIDVPGASAFLNAVFSRVVEQLPGTSYEIMGPFGLGCEYGVSITEDGGTLAHLSFRAGDGANALLIDADSDTGRFAENTLGRINGLHRVSRPLEDDLSTLVEQIKAQIAENRLRRMAQQ